MNALRTIPCLILLAAAACGAPGRDIKVDVDPAPALAPRAQVGEEVGRLLSPDPHVSQSAQQRLIALDGEDRDAFLRYAATLEGERDLRLLHVLDEHHALPEMDSEQLLDFLLWKAARPERFYVMKAQSRLMDLARKDPDALIGRLQRGGPGGDVLGIVLGVTGTRSAVPALIERYRDAGDSRARAAAAEALGMLAGEARRPRTSGSAGEIARDAAALADWYREQVELERERAEEERETAGAPR